MGLQNDLKQADVSQLIHRAKGGDGEAFEMLLEKYTPLINASVARCLQNDQYASYVEDSI